MQFISNLTCSVLFLGICLEGCMLPQNKSTEEPVYASIDSILIYRSDVDKLISQELYDELCRIYLIRQTALQGVINEKLLQKEADKQSISIDSLLNRYYQDIVKNKWHVYVSKYPQYFREGHSDGSVFVSVSDSLRFYNILKAEAKEELCTLLSHTYTIKTNLRPPVSPRLDLQYTIVHYRGNLSSSVTCLEMSDFDCSNCKMYHPVMDSLYRKYKNRVRFAFTHYGSYPSLSARACESAAQQNKFWEMQDTLMKMSQAPRQLEELEPIARDLHLDLKKFETNLRDTAQTEAILQNMKLLEKSGIYGTPTIAVNNRILFNASSFEDVDRQILEALKNEKE